MAPAMPTTAEPSTKDLKMAPRNVLAHGGGGIAVVADGAQSIRPQGELSARSHRGSWSQHQHDDEDHAKGATHGDGRRGTDTGHVELHGEIGEPLGNAASPVSSGTGRGISVTFFTPRVSQFSVLQHRQDDLGNAELSQWRDSRNAGPASHARSD